MTSKTSIVAILIIISMATSSSTCKKHFGCAENIYSFDMDIKAYPDRDSIRIGDTIWLEVNLPTTLKDKTSGNLINYNNAENLGLGMSYLELADGNLNNSRSVPAANLFNNILLKGFPVQNSRTDQVREFLFTESSAMYEFKVGIVAQKKATFSIAPSNAANVYRKNDKCTKASFLTKFKDTNQHIYLYEQSRPGYTPSEYERTHTYCFKVI